MGRRILLFLLTLLAAVSFGQFGNPMAAMRSANLEYNPGLIFNPAVHKELKLSPAVASKLSNIVMSEGMKLLPMMSGGGSSPAQQQKAAQAALQSFQAMQSKIAAALTPAQRKRLREITLQSIGPAAVLQPKVAASLGLSSGQKSRLQTSFSKISAGAFSSLSAMKPPKAGQSPDPAAWKAQMKKLEAAQKQARARSDAALGAVLTAPQKAKWKAMLGRPMNLTGLAGVGNIFG